MSVVFFSDDLVGDLSSVGSAMGDLWSVDDTTGRVFFNWSVDVAMGTTLAAVASRFAASVAEMENQKIMV